LPLHVLKYFPKWNFFQ